MGLHKRQHSFILHTHLGKGIGKCCCKEEIGICTSGVDPEVPQHRAEDGGNEKHTENDQRVAEVWREEKRRERVVVC